MKRLCLLYLILLFPFLVSSAEVLLPTPTAVENKIRQLDALTPLSLEYNESVQAYIDVYTIQRKDHLAGIIGRAELYFPLFEEYLDKMELPLELKYLAVVESALNPKARSTSGAMGLWQLLYQASRLFDMEVNSYIDERCDPVKSTEAACKYLKYLYSNFHDWNLALAAYNGGIATVWEAISKAGGETDFWAVRRYLPAETQSYVPAFIAVNYVMNHYEDYGVEPIQAPFNYDEIGFINLDFSISFDQLAQLTDTSIELLQLLNPAYSKNYIPVNSPPLKIIIPLNKVLHFIENKHLLYKENGPPEEIKDPIGSVKNRKKVLHIVQPGEFFHRIAMEYRVRVEDIQQWNNLKSRHLKAGQELEIWYKPKTTPYFFVNKEFQHFLE